MAPQQTKKHSAVLKNRFHYWKNWCSYHGGLAMRARQIHPFGILLRNLLGRQGYSQSRLVSQVIDGGFVDRYGVTLDDRIVSQMCRYGKHLSGSDGRRRVLAILEGLRQADILLTLDEANELLNVADLAPLNATRPDENQLLQALITTRPAPNARAPAHTTLPCTNLPHQLTSFIGRQQELATLKQMILTTQLLTLTGVGGVGKTRLAIELAHQLTERYPDGIWFAELAALREPALVPQTVVTVLALPEQAASDPLSVLTLHLESKHTLLILDNCEHLVDACATLSVHLLHHCPMLTILATSREMLRIDGETVYRVPSLSIPPLSLTNQHTGNWLKASMVELLAFDAAHLFIER